MPKIKRAFDRALVEKTHLYDILPLMTQRYPHLTPEEHQKRFTVAAHEAAHLIASLCVKGGHPGPYAYIRVPRNPSKHFMRPRGADGMVSCGGYTNYAEAFIYAAGGIADLIMGSPDFDTAIAHDDIQFERHLKGHIEDTHPGADERQTAIGILDDCLALIAPLWDMVEKAAVAMLLHADRKGNLTGDVWDEVRSYIESKLAVQERWAEHTCHRLPRSVRSRLQELQATC
jgi:hypothetical protein